LQMGPGIVDRQSLCCTRRNGHIGSQSWRTGSEIDSQPEAVKASGLFPGRRFRIVSALPTTRKLARPVNTRAFVSTDPLSLAANLLFARHSGRHPPRAICGVMRAGCCWSLDDSGSTQIEVSHCPSLAFSTLSRSCVR
jgi:hypothetical protein